MYATQNVSVWNYLQCLYNVTDANALLLCTWYKVDNATMQRII